jgi:uncharacterized protein YcbX
LSSHPNFINTTINMKIEALYTYPIKALRAQSLDSATCTKHGFAYERRFMLLEEKLDKETNGKTYRNMHIAHDPAGALFFPTLNPPSSPDAKDGTINVVFSPPKDSGKQEATLTIPLEPSAKDLEEVEITMHKSPTKAYRMPAEYNDWFSSCFGYAVVLAHLGGNYRPILMSTPSTSALKSNTDPSSNSNNSGSGWLSSMTSTAASYLPSLNASNPQSQEKPKELTFSDCAPYLIVSQTSVEALSTRLSDDSKADITKFRPNIVVSGAASAWEEDFWAELTMQRTGESVNFTAAHNCARCKSVNIDYETGAPGKGADGKLLSVMQRDRRVDPGMKYSPVFGRYCFLGGEGDEGREVRVGDEVVVGKANEERTVFGELSFLEGCPVFCPCTTADACVCRLGRPGYDLLVKKKNKTPRANEKYATQTSSNTRVACILPVSYYPITLTPHLPPHRSLTSITRILPIVLHKSRYRDLTTTATSSCRTRKVISPPPTTTSTPRRDLPDPSDPQQNIMRTPQLPHKNRTPRLLQPHALKQLRQSPKTNAQLLHRKTHILNPHHTTTVELSMPTHHTRRKRRPNPLPPQPSPPSILHILNSIQQSPSTNRKQILIPNASPLPTTTLPPLSPIKLLVICILIILPLPIMILLLLPPPTKPNLTPPKQPQHPLVRIRQILRLGAEISLEAFGLVVSVCESGREGAGGFWEGWAVRRWVGGMRGVDGAAGVGR